MHLLSREEAGLRCLLRVAAHEGAGPLPIGEIARAEGLSPEYTAKLMRRLRIGGLVSSRRGATGGYQLCRPAAKTSVWEALQVLDDSFLPADDCSCAREAAARGDCTRTSQCAIQSLWRSVGTQVREVLERTTLAQLAGSAVEVRFDLPVVGSAVAG